MEVITLESLKDTITAISPIECMSLTEHCICALEHNDHISGCRITVSGINFTNFTINWTTKINKAGYQNTNVFIERGALALSFFLCVQFTGYTVIQQAQIGTGVDYWLGYDKEHNQYDPKNFLRARLEVSGINNETNKNNIARRLRNKKSQTAKSDAKRLPAFISIIEFASPKAHFEEK